MSVLNDTLYLNTLRIESDYTNVRFEHSTRELRDIVARMIGYMPWWLFLLYVIRAGLAALLRLDTVTVPRPAKYSAEDVPMQPGERFDWLIVESAEDGKYWSGRINDRHLDAWLVVTLDPLFDNVSRVGFTTFVNFHNRSGRFYLWLITPFKHLVSRAMLNYAVKS